MTRSRSAAAWILAAASWFAGTAASSAQERGPTTPLGFLPGSRAAQAKAEAVALATPDSASARSMLRTLTEEPHVAGTPADHRTAIYVRDRLRSFGWTAELAEYPVLLNYPRPGSVRLEIVRPEAKPLKVTEDAYAADKDSADPAAFPAFHGYGIDGNVTAQVVYANYGRPEDFAALDRLGVDVKGKIVLVRYYGGLFRGLKLYNAQKHGAKGVLIYSDPADDGYGRGDAYPIGPYRPPSGIQRGSVQFLSHGPGDPSTPGTASLPGAARLPLEGLIDNHQDAVAEVEKRTGKKRIDYFAEIPSLPISYEAARPILEALGGPNVPTGWQGGLPFPYHAGPGPVEVHFSVSMDYKVRPVWNVIARIEGTVEPDRWIMIGNHRDAWVYGAVDPSSGTAATLEACRAIGAAVKAGWKPKRTLLYASWDAEEYGLVGSSEWAEHHAEEIDRSAVLMLNVDSAVGGPDLDLDGIPSMRDLVLDAAAAVTDPRTGKPLRDGWLERARASWAAESPIDLDDAIWHGETGRSSASVFRPRMNALGSGSDYTAFVDHLGVPAVDINFSGRYGVYHSIYDDFFWMEKFGDPEFILHTTAARLYAVIALRAASADVVPLTFTPYAEAIRDHVDDLRRAVARKARTAEGRPKPPLEFVRLGGLVKAVRDFTERAEQLDKTIDGLANRDGLQPETLRKVNDALTRVERALLHREGLPGRPWFKHTIYAPGLTTGYASWPLPGVRKAILDEDAATLGDQVGVLIDRLRAAGEALRAAQSAAEPGP